MVCQTWAALAAPECSGLIHGWVSDLFKVPFSHTRLWAPPPVSQRLADSARTSGPHGAGCWGVTQHDRWHCPGKLSRLVHGERAHSRLQALFQRKRHFTLVNSCVAPSIQASSGLWVGPSIASCVARLLLLSRQQAAEREFWVQVSLPYQIRHLTRLWAINFRHVGSQVAKATYRDFHVSGAERWRLEYIYIIVVVQFLSLVCFLLKATLPHVSSLLLPYCSSSICTFWITPSCKFFLFYLFFLATLFLVPFIYPFFVIYRFIKRNLWLVLS